MVDTEKLISEVQKRPILYDPRMGGNSWKELKPGLWVEVCRELIPNWDGLSGQEQERRVIDTQKRWRTLRDNFKRELKYQRSVKSGAVATRRKKYKHYDVLQFLEPIMDRRWPSVCDYGQYKVEPILPEDITVTLNGGGPGDETVHSIGDDESKYNADEYSDEADMKYSGAYHSPGGHHHPAQFDPDEMFFYSMLPAFKRLTEEQKSLAKVKITQIMHEIVYSKSGRDSTHSESPQECA